MSLKITFLSCLFLSCLFTSNIFSQAIHTDDIIDSVDIEVDIFNKQGVIDLTLEFDRRAFKKNKFEDEYQSATLTYHAKDGIGDRYDKIRIKPRGKNRREQCSFPPVWINIKKAEVLNQNLQETKKIKLVTHCGNKTFEQYILKEFLSYKIYNILSPYSFRVLLGNITYIDSEKKKKPISTICFLIEPENMLASRCNMMPFKNDNLSMYHTDSIWTTHMSLFNYMIGNSDYSVATRHNVKLLFSNNGIKQNVIPVPYDFDYTGFVDAHYAIPGEDLGISDIKQRYYNGPCRTPEEYQKAIDDMVLKKTDIMDLINNFDALDEKHRNNALKYIEEFYSLIQDPSFIQKQLQSTCVEKAF